MGTRCSNCNALYPIYRSVAWSENMKRHSCNLFLLLALCALISFDGLVSTARAQNIPNRIEIVVVEGEGVTTLVRQRVNDVVVRVDDDDHRPVAEVAVVFALSASGTTGEFPNGTQTLTVMTDKNGLATARGIRTNDIPGKLQIYVTASYHGLRARTLINQVVTAAPGAKPREPTVQTAKSGKKWKWVILGIAAAGGAGAGVYFGIHNSSPPTPISIGTGTVTFGSPR
jgi:hypothetical protein